MTTPRVAIPDFATENAHYAGATVSVWTVDEDLAKTSTLATLYANPTGSTLLANPQDLDSRGKWTAPVYVDQPVIMTVTAGTDTHDTGIVGALPRWRGDWVTNTLYFAGDRLTPPGGTVAIAVVLVTHTSGVYADDLSNGFLTLEISVAALSTGIVTLTTNTSLSTSTEFVATGSAGPGTGLSAYFTPNANCGASAFLTWNGTRRRLRNAAGQVMSDGLLRSGQRYQIHDDGTDYVVIDLLLTQRFQSRVNFIGTSATLDFYATDGGSVVGRQSVDSTGKWLFQSNGSTAIEIQADLDIRAVGGRWLNAYQQEVYHPANPQETDFDDVKELVETVQGFTHEGSITPLTATDTLPVPVTGFDLNRRGWANVNNGWQDFEPLPTHGTFETAVGDSKVVNFYTGSATSFLNRTSNVVQVTGPALVRVSKLQEEDEMLISAAVGTLSDVATPTIPVYGRTWVGGGQSWMARSIRNGLAGVLQTYRDLEDANPATRTINAAVGASALLYGAATVSTNYWWHHLDGLPGPNAEAMRDAIIAWVAANPTQPFPEAVLWAYGLNDLNAFAATGDNTPAAWTQAQEDLQAWLDDELSTALSTTVELNHFIAPLPARKLGVFDESLWYAMRACQLDVVANAPRTYRLADYYDLVRRWNDEHHGFYMQARWGARWPWFIENALHSGTNYEGPQITDFHEIDSRTYWFRIERGYVSPGVTASLQRPEMPAGFAVLPAGSSLIQTKLEVARYRWTTDENPGGDPQDDDILEITLRTASAGGQPAYPYGSSWEMQQPSRVVRDLRTMLPLKTYHPTV